MTTYELRDDPDDLPHGTYYSLREAKAAAQRRAERTCQPVLIYEVDDDGQRFVCSVW